MFIYLRLECEILENNYIHKKLIEDINERIDEQLIYFTSMNITFEENVSTA